MTENTTEKLLKVATVAAAHGIGGEVRLRVFLEDKSAFSALGPFLDVAGKDLGSVDLRGQSKGQFIARLCGANTRDAAEALKGLNLFIPRNRLPEPEEEEFYYSDLIGLDVRHEGTSVGKVKSLRDHGAGDLLEISFENGRTDYFSFSRAIFPEIQLVEGWIGFVPPAEILSQDEDGKVH